MSETVLPAPETSQLPASPYKGLVPYTEEDAPFFFGREADQEIIISNLLVWRLTLFYGASGVGKSSVLGAGVIPELRRRSLDNLEKTGSPGQTVVYFNTWRTDPLVSLVAATAEAVSRAWEGRQFASLPTDLPLVQVLRAWTERLEGELLIILDQFEEYFLYHSQEKAKDSFAYQFAQVVKESGLAVNFLISIREDSLAKLDRFKDDLSGLFDNLLRLEHLDQATARQAITKPLAEYNRRLANSECPPVAIEPELEEVVLQQVAIGTLTLVESERVGSASGPIETGVETPYLQLVLTRLWEEEQANGSSRLRLATLERLGGAEQIVRTHLDKVMNDLSASEQEAAARMFRHFVTGGGGKFAQSLPDLAELTELPEARLQPVLEKLAGSGVRILRPFASPDHPDQVNYEIFHDVLAAAILDWRRRYAEKLRLIEQERQAESLRQEQERLLKEKARLRQLRLVLGAMAALLLLLIVAIIATFFAVNLAGEAQRQSSVASTARANAENQANLASTQGAEAQRQANLASTQKAEANVARQQADTARQQADRLRVGSETLAQALQAQTFNDPEQTLLFVREDARRVVNGQANDANGQIESLLRQSLATSKVRAVMRGHIGTVYNVTYSPDGKYVLSQSPSVISTNGDGTARIWDAASGKQLGILGGSDYAVVNANFSKDGKYVITVGKPDTNSSLARVWETATGKLLAQFGGDHSISEAFLSPDDRLVLTVSNSWNGGYAHFLTSEDGTARVWDLFTHQQLATLGPSPDEKYPHTVVTAAFSPDSKLVVTGSSNWNARVWEATTGKKISDLIGHQYAIKSVAFSPDSKYVLTTVYSNQAAQLWEVASGKPLTILGDSVEQATFSPNGTFVVLLTISGSAQVWRNDPTAGWKLFHTLDLSDIEEEYFSPNEKYIALRTRTAGEIQVWDLATGNRLVTLAGGSHAVTQMAFSPDSQLIATTSQDYTAKIWETTTGKELLDLRGHTNIVNDLAFSPDGTFIATGSDDHTVRLWQIGESLLVSGPPWQKYATNGITFSRDGKLAATSGNDTDFTARIWEIDTGKLRAELKGHTKPLTSVVFSQDSTLLVTTSDDQTTRLWNTASGQQLDLFPYATRVQISPDNRFLALAHVGLTLPTSFHLREIATNREIPIQQEQDNNDTIYMPVFSPDSKYLLLEIVYGGYSYNTEGRVFDTSSGKLVSELISSKYDYSSNTPSFSSDSKYIATSRGDGVIRIWETTSGKLLTTMVGHTGFVNRTSFSPDSKYLVSAASDYTARIWEVSTGVNLAVLRGHAGSVKDAFFSLNGKLVITASDDGTIRLWDVGTGKELAVLRGYSQTEGFSNDGQKIFVINPVFEIDRTIVTQSQVFACSLCGSLADLLKLADSRVTRPLTSQERLQLVLTDATASPSPTPPPAATPGSLPTVTPSPGPRDTPTP